jgi:Methyltransferase domain
MWCWHGYEFVLAELAHTDASFLEIGVLDGDLFSGVARAFPNRCAYGIDPFVNPGDITKETGVPPGATLTSQRASTYNNISALPNAILYETTSLAFSQQLTDSQVHEMNIGIVLIDGSPNYDDVLNDLVMSVRLIGTKSGVIILDDVGVESIARAKDTFIGMYADKITDTFTLMKQENNPSPYGAYDIYTVVFRLN